MSPEEKTWIYTLLAFVLYATQLVEFCLSATNRMLWRQGSWEDFKVFKMWFQELKKCRPAVKFSYTPSAEHTALI